MTIVTSRDSCHDNSKKSLNHRPSPVKIIGNLLLFTFLTCHLKLVHSVELELDKNQDQNRNHYDTETPTSSSLPFLQKCPGSEIPDEVRFLVIPPEIRLGVPEKTQYYQTKFNTTSLFHFNLLPLPKPESDGSKSQPASQLAPVSCLASSKSYFSVELLWTKTKEPRYRGIFDPRGVIILRHNPKDVEIYYHPKNYCIHRMTSDGFVAHFCKTPCANDTELLGDETPCIPKCCFIGEKMYYNDITKAVGCQKTVDEDMNFRSIYSDSLDASDPTLGKIPGVFPNFMNNGRLHHFPLWDCSAPPNNLSSSPFHSLNFQKKNIRLTKSGSIYNWKKYWPYPKYEILYEGSSIKRWQDPNASRSETFNRPPICIEEIFHYVKNNASGKISGDANVPYVLGQMCWTNFKRLEKNQQEYEEFLRGITVTYPRIKFWIFLASTLVYLCTMGVYVVLWSQQNVHGWTVFTFTVCNFLLCLESTVQEGCQGYEAFEWRRLLDDLFPLCLFFGIGRHFLLIACFSWTAMLSFDAWAKLRSMTATSRTYKGGKRFLAYCLVGFSFPFLWVLIAVLVEFNSDCEVQLCPGYSKYCSIYLNSAYYVYTLMPILVLFLLSMIFASLTVHFILSAKKNMTTLKSKDSRSTSKSHNNAKLAVKLFLMMGVLLIFEVVQSIHNPIVNSLGWVVLDFYRLFHALAIFWIFIGNARMLKNLGERLTIVRRFIEPATETTSLAQSTTPQTPTSVKKFKMNVK